MLTELINEFKSELANKYPQYLTLLSKKIRIAEAKRDYKGGRVGAFWYKKGEKLLAFGEVKEEMCWSKERRKFDIPRYFITVYSHHNKGLCSAPIEHLIILEN